MKAFLCILLLGYMIFGVTPNPNNEPLPGKTLNAKGDNQLQDDVKEREVIPHAVFLDAKGNILPDSVKDTAPAID
ncbi:MAG TPA: hypothetical protein VFZ52_04200 [Chryseolinea sp.]